MRAIFITLFLLLLAGENLFAQVRVHPQGPHGRPYPPAANSYNPYQQNFRSMLHGCHPGVLQEFLSLSAPWSRGQNYQLYIADLETLFYNNQRCFMSGVAQQSIAQQRDLARRLALDSRINPRDFLMSLSGYERDHRYREFFEAYRRETRIPPRGRRIR